MTYIKYNCPHCKQHLEVPVELLGTLLECPTCQTAIQLPKASGDDKVASTIKKEVVLHQETRQCATSYTKLRFLTTTIVQIPLVYKIIAAISVIILTTFLLVMVLRTPSIRHTKDMQWRENGLVPYEVNSRSPYSGIIISYRGDAPKTGKKIEYTDDLISIKRYKHGIANGEQIHLNMADGVDSSIDRIEYVSSKDFPRLDYTSWYSTGQKEASFHSESPIGGNFSCWYPNGQIRSTGIYGLRITLSRFKEITLRVILFVSYCFTEKGEQQHVRSLSWSDRQLYWPQEEAFDFVFATPLGRFANRIARSHHDLTVSKCVQTFDFHTWFFMYKKEIDKAIVRNTKMFLQCDSDLALEFLISNLKTPLK